MRAWLSSGTHATEGKQAFSQAFLAGAAFSSLWSGCLMASLRCDTVQEVQVLSALTKIVRPGWGILRAYGLICETMQAVQVKALSRADQNIKECCAYYQGMQVKALSHASQNIKECCAYVPKNVGQGIESCRPKHGGMLCLCTQGCRSGQ
eukprot:1160963-Pelagomonas_calceolata.AAC.4